MKSRIYLLIWPLMINISASAMDDINKIAGNAGNVADSNITDFSDDAWVDDTWLLNKYLENQRKEPVTFTSEILLSKHPSSETKDDLKSNYYKGEGLPFKEHPVHPEK